MTNQPTSQPDRLDRIEEILFTVARRQEVAQAQVDTLIANQQLMQQDIQLLFHRWDEAQARWEAMQSDIRGLQTENRRILERLEQHFSDGHGGDRP